MEQHGGYSIPYVRDVVSSTTAIYTKPMQSKLDLERLAQPSLGDEQVKTQCENCKRDIPIQSIKEHFDTCPGGVVEEAAVTVNEQPGGKKPRSDRFLFSDM